MVEHGRVFRVRKIDVARRLPLVRDLRELDNKGEDLRASRRGVTHGQEASDAERVVTSRLAGARDIPVPSVRVVPTYEEDYEPAFESPRSGCYIKRAGLRVALEGGAEYDMDGEDERWLAAQNAKGGGGHALGEEDFERLMTRLEHACAEASGVTSGDEGGRSALPGVDAAMAALAAEESGSGEDVLAAVHAYWRQKRLRWRKPLLRRLQPAPAVDPSNPYNIFGGGRGEGKREGKGGRKAKGRKGSSAGRGLHSIWQRRGKAKRAKRAKRCAKRCAELLVGLVDQPYEAECSGRLCKVGRWVEWLWSSLKWVSTKRLTRIL